ncbi:orange carotenoid protein N-terminal domain-containing protein [Kamptonema cortianum]|uniref:Orange carotenoid protein N-terminal domain-containing protein n=1 Tax=Geitlerinema calcuttense NRMC-F 0142 TaxID=2922238 RepID=A0ABT7LYL8_9CYAN|nr:orange carotenoid protein N-terminal domain-containing protein [Geitlerinema calcuttense]MDI9640162.1 orange carotenoid protein N-terminal domain-containing protein [Geitlerinema splendidum]MDK3158232.1 orange carotenoid protein N-terminal domain-containing protein [Kamptonema cortianum]MDL5056490.1 orange carotenoid protein N-terminal domain-containing protein [Geitlerinema calcuttense NRMC-F 0142]
MTSINTDPNQKALQKFNSLSVDDRLAFLWFVYTEMGESITPAAPGSAAPEIAEGLFNQVKEKSHDEQLQVMRDLVNNADTLICREYGSFSDNTKLLFWYRLSQGMESQIIVPMPPNYEMAETGNELLEQLKGFDFNQQITFLRDSVMGMGAEPKGGSDI